MTMVSKNSSGHGDYIAHVYVQALRLDDVVVNDKDLKTALILRWKVLDEFPELGSTNAIGAIHRQRALRLLAAQCSLESGAELLVVTLLGGCTVRILGALGVEAADHVMELRCGEKAVLLDLSLGGRKTVLEAAKEPGA